MPDFDPYHKWLGIPPQHQPPNYYRLLALDLYESDLEVIEAAVDRLVFFLQDVATGPQAKHSQKLLNEIAAARLCLLDRQRKSAYDEQLRAESDDEMPPPVVDIEPGPIPVPPAQKRLTVNARPKHVNALAPRKSVRRVRRRNSALLLWGIVAGGALLMGAALVSLIMTGSNDEARRRPAEGATAHEQQGNTPNASKIDR